MFGRMGDTGPETGPGNTSRFGGCFQLGFMLGTILFAIAAVVVALAGNSLWGVQGSGGQQNQPGVGPGEVNPGNQGDPQGNPANPGNEQGNQGNPQPNAPDVIPPIADADWVSGTTDLNSSGFITLDTTIAIDPVPSLTMDDATYIQFGTSGGSGASLLIHIIDGTAGITLAQGNRSASASEENCSVQVEASGGTVSGSVTCANIASYDTASGDVGMTSFHLTFSAQGG